jgi:hypothetical protein
MARSSTSWCQRARPTAAHFFNQALRVGTNPADVTTDGAARYPRSSIS